MINLIDYGIFKNHVCTLKDTSFDTENSEYMIDSTIDVVNFDGVKTEYANKLDHSNEDAASVDAIVCTKDRIFFIEFKNGLITDKQRKQLKYKVQDSLLIFGDIVGITVSNTRKFLEFILVYNKEKNPVSHQKLKAMGKEPSRTSIGKYISELAGEEFIQFGLGRYKSLYFKNVHTYTVKEFQKFLKMNEILSE